MQIPAEEFKAAKGIKAMPEDSRPREKLFAQGGAKLRTEELLAMLVGSGTPGESAVELGKRIFDGHGSRAHLLKACNFSSLCKYKDMGVPRQASSLRPLNLPEGFIFLLHSLRRFTWLKTDLEFNAAAAALLMLPFCRFAAFSKTVYYIALTDLLSLINIFLPSDNIDKG